MNRLSKNEEHIKKVLNEHEFDFDPAQWDAAEALLDDALPQQPKKKKRKFGFFWILLPLFVLAGGGGAWWAYTNNIFGTKPQATQWQGTKEDTTATADNTNPYQYTEETTADDNYTAAPTPQPEAELGGPPALMVAKQYDKHTTGTQANANSNTNYTADATTPTGSNATPNFGQGFSQPQNTNSPTGKGGKGNSNNNGATTPQQGNNNPSNNKNNSQGGENNNNAGDGDNTQTPITNNTPQGSNTTPQNNATPNNSQQEQQQSATTPPKPDSAQQTKGTDTAQNQPPRREKEEKQILLKNSISPVIGSNYSQLLQPTGTQYNNRLYYGIWYNRHINNNWQFATGLAYTSVNTNGFSKQYTEEKYSFGIHSQQAIISTQRLHYIELPLMLRYSVLKQISLVGGITLNYLLTTNNTIEKRTFASLSGQSQSTEKTTAYMQGINPLDVQLQLGIEAHITPRLHLGIIAGNGMFDVGRNNYYNNTVFDRNRRLQLFLRYDVVRF